MKTISVVPVLFILANGVFPALSCNLTAGNVNCFKKQSLTFTGDRSNVVALNLSNGYIGEIRSGAFRGFTKLEVLTLTHSAIQLIEDGAFDGLQSLKKLYLDQNGLIYGVPEDIFENLTNLELVSLDVSSVRAFSCGPLCSRLKTFIYGSFCDGKSFSEFCRDSYPCVSGNHNCSQQAMCMNTSDAFECQCLSGYSGDGTTCQDIDECSIGNIGNTPCNASGNAVCDNMPGSYNCRCMQGYTGNGEYCTEMFECISNPCIHGRCRDRLGSYACECTSGYTGTLCEINIDECALGPCLNGGTCTDLVDGYACACNSSYTSQNCTTDTDECLAVTHDCHSKASCSNTQGSYVCTCIQDYTGNGTTCQQTAGSNFGAAGGNTASSSSLTTQSLGALVGVVFVVLLCAILTLSVRKMKNSVADLNRRTASYGKHLRVASKMSRETTMSMIYADRTSSVCEKAKPPSGLPTGSPRGGERSGCPISPLAGDSNKSVAFPRLDSVGKASDIELGKADETKDHGQSLIKSHSTVGKEAPRVAPRGFHDANEVYGGSMAGDNEPGLYDISDQLNLNSVAGMDMARTSSNASQTTSRLINKGEVKPKVPSGNPYKLDSSQPGKSSVNPNVRFIEPTLSAASSSFYGEIMELVGDAGSGRLSVSDQNTDTAPATSTTSVVSCVPSPCNSAMHVNADGGIKVPFQSKNERANSLVKRDNDDDVYGNDTYDSSNIKDDVYGNEDGTGDVYGNEDVADDVYGFDDVTDDVYGNEDEVGQVIGSQPAGGKYVTKHGGGANGIHTAL